MNWTEESSKWDITIGKAKSVPWPTGIGDVGNEGVAKAIKGSPYTIGYVELAFALTTKMPYAYLQNQARKFIGTNNDVIT